MRAEVFIGGEFPRRIGFFKRGQRGGVRDFHGEGDSLVQFDLRIKQADGLSLTLAKAVKHFQRLFLEVGEHAKPGEARLPV